MTQPHTASANHASQSKSLTTSEPIISGIYEVRMAQSAWEVREAQKLRYRLLYLERGGRPDELKTSLEADADEWDARAQHVIVLDRSGAAPKVVGTLRLVATSALADEQRFYTEQAFDLSALRNRFPQMLELGRFCIEASKRHGTILLLIWKYTMQFIVDNRIELMFGCASFPGTNLDEHRDILGYLYQHNLAEEALRPTPRLKNHVQLATFASEEKVFDNATRQLPTLLRGYLKLGARVSDCAIVDPIFNTTFVCIYVEAREMLEGNTPLVRHRRRSAATG